MAKPDALFITDAQLAERIGLTTEQMKAKTSVLEKSGFPTKDVMFENRRYWPAVRAWLDRRYGMGGEGSTPSGPDGKENWD